VWIYRFFTVAQCDPKRKKKIGGAEIPAERLPFFAPKGHEDVAVGGAPF